MDDGAVLYASRFYPRDSIEQLPIVLVRTPYAPRGDKPDLMSRLIVERGYQVVVQNCRGRFGSQGEWEPFRADREDGLATLRWLEEQPWFGGDVAMFGVSYYGYAQFAAGAGAPSSLKALVPQMSPSRIYGIFRPAGTLALDSALAWHYSVYAVYVQSGLGMVRAILARGRVLQRALRTLPIGEADRVVVGRRQQFFQDIIRSARPEDEVWAATDHSKLVERIEAPVHLVSGWYDFVLDDLLADYQSLRDAGRVPYLTIGPWTHGAFPAVKVGLQESLAWYDAHLRGRTDALRASPVRICVMGSNRWVELPSWPPAATPTSWYLDNHAQLSSTAPGKSAGRSRYRYDPADPTPNVGGALVLGGGSKDNRKRERRADVLTFTSPAMQNDTTIIGTAEVNLQIRSSLEHTDVHVRLCDVSPGNRSLNVCDGIIRLTPADRPGPDGVHQLGIQLNTTAHCFRAGHRIRLQVSSGAHPRFNRNLGTDDIAHGVTMRVADQEVLHDSDHPSVLVLPVAP
jgi:putative CocE/NonD family hydrolase